MDISRFKVFALLVGFFILCACAGEKSKTDGSSTDPTVDGNTDGSPLYVEVLTSFENTTDTTSHGKCYFDSTATAPASKTCTIRIPELTLFYSDLHFNVGTSSALSCTQVSFNPYYYRKSNAAAFAGEDCTTGDKKVCWGGAAPDLIEEFPKATGLYFLPAAGLSSSYKIKSSNSRFLADEDDDVSLRSNVNTCNNLASGLRANPISSTKVEYEGGVDAFYDYSIVCADKWAETQFEITIIIADYDTDGSASGPAANDHRWDWGD